MSNPTEKEFLDHFLGIYQFTNKPLEIIKTESPDFILKFPKNTLGIEITELYKKYDQKNEPARRKAIESGWESTLGEASNIWESRGYPKIEVDVTFNENYHVSKKNYKQIANNLVEIVYENLPLFGNCNTIESENFKIGYFPQEVLRIIIWRIIKYNRSYWHFSDGCIVPDLTIQQVKEAISKKNSKIDRYLKKCNKIWLLIILHGWRVSSSMDIPDEVIDNKYKSNFNNIILFHTLRESVQELKTVPV